MHGSLGGGAKAKGPTPAERDSRRRTRLSRRRAPARVSVSSGRRASSGAFTTALPASAAATSLPVTLVAKLPALAATPQRSAVSLWHGFSLVHPLRIRISVHADRRRGFMRSTAVRPETAQRPTSCGGIELHARGREIEALLLAPAPGAGDCGRTGGVPRRRDPDAYAAIEAVDVVSEKSTADTGSSSSRSSTLSSGTEN